jgi:hypothetical protein
MMSDNEAVDVEVITPSVDDLIRAISGEQALDVGQIFGNLMSAKVEDALEAEKVRVAGEIYNGTTADDDDVSEEEVDAALAELESMEQEEQEEPVAEVEEPVAEVEEPAVEVEEPVAEIGADVEHEEVEDDLGLYGDEEAAADVDSILSDEELPETEE